MTTENAVSSAVTRRDVLKGAAALSAAGVAASALPLTHAVAAEEVTDAEGNLTVPSFLVKPEPITDFAETVDYDVVVVGAGEAGLSAIHTALEAGATVACLQNTSIPFTTGNMAACIDLEKTDEAAIQACLSMINWKSDFRSNRALVEMWARTGQEALAWWEQAGAEGGFESQPYDYSISYNHYDMFFHANTYFHLEGAHNDPAQVIAEQEAAAGCVFYYDTPAVQLKVEEDGSVSGAIGQREDGTYILVNAAKGVILCTGDYTGNLEMRDYYCPDAKGFQAGVALRDGSGFAMGMWAGAQLTGVNHTKMIHGEGAPVRLEMPFLFLDTKGRRFMDENCGGRMGYLNNYQRAMLAENGYENVYSAKVWSIVPSNWADYVEEWQAANPYEISVHNAYRDVDPSQWVTADTFEGLAEAMNAYAEANEWGIEPVDVQTVVDSITRYEELCEKGADEDFGKDPMYLAPMGEPPYYAVPRGSIRTSAILSGLECDGNGQCYNTSWELIPGLYAAGNASGQFFGGVDYPMNIEGLSIGRAIASGYYVGRYVASL